MSDLGAFSRPFGVLVLLSSLGVSAVASAQSDEQRAAARSLATEGVAAFNDGRFKDSADMFARAESLVHAPTHLLYLARSYAKIGQVVRARETYMRIVKEQLPASAPPQFRDAQSAAQDELRTVEPRIAKLTIQVNGAQDAKDLQVSVDGRPVPAVMIGVPQPIDPGEHRIEGVATGKRAKPQSIALRDGERSSVTLQMENDPSAVAPPPASTAAPAPGESPAATTPPPASGPAANVAPVTAPPESTGGVRSYTVGGIGIGAGLLGVGSAIFGVISLSNSSSKRDEADKACSLDASTGKCRAGTEAAVKQLDEDADSARAMGVVGLVAGGVFVAGGITMVIYGFGSKSEARTGSLVPVVGPSYLGVRGSF